MCASKHRTLQNLLEIVLKHQVTMGLVSSESDVLGSMERDEDHPYRWSTTFFAHPSHPGQIDNMDFVKDRFVVQFDANEFVKIWPFHRWQIRSAVTRPASFRGCTVISTLKTDPLDSSHPSTASTAFEAIRRLRNPFRTQ